MGRLEDPARACGQLEAQSRNAPTRARPDPCWSESAMRFFHTAPRVRAGLLSRHPPGTRPGARMLAAVRTRSRSRGAGAPDVVMVLENCSYPLDARVQNEAQSLTAGPHRGSARAARSRRTRARADRRRSCQAPAADRGARRACRHGARVPQRMRHARWRGAREAGALPRGTLHVHNPPDVFFPLLALARLRGWSRSSTTTMTPPGCFATSSAGEPRWRPCCAGCAISQRA